MDHSHHDQLTQAHVATNRISFQGEKLSVKHVNHVAFNELVQSILELFQNLHYLNELELFIFATRK